MIKFYWERIIFLCEVDMTFSTTLPKYISVKKIRVSKKIAFILSDWELVTRGMTREQQQPSSPKKPYASYYIKIFI